MSSLQDSEIFTEEVHEYPYLFDNAKLQLLHLPMTFTMLFSSGKNIMHPKSRF